MPPIKVVLADDHTLFRKCLAEFLSKSPELLIVGEAADGHQTLEVINDTQPDIVLLDLEMPALNGFDVLKTLREEKSSVKSIVISMYFNQSMIAKAKDYGAKGFMHKSADIDEILEAIQTVHHNGVYISEEKNIKLPPSILALTGLSAVNNNILHIFTNKEIEILQYLKEGLTSKEIGDKMYLSPRTIEDNRQQMMEKAHVHNVAALLQFAFKNEIIIA